MQRAQHSCPFTELDLVVSSVPWAFLIFADFKVSIDSTKYCSGPFVGSSCSIGLGASINRPRGVSLLHSYTETTSILRL